MIGKFVRLKQSEKVWYNQKTLKTVKGDRWKNRVLVAVLSIIMVICLLPGAVFADETGVELSEANFPDKTLRE